MHRFKRITILFSVILTIMLATLSCLGSISVNGIESSSEDSLYEIIRNKDPDNNGYLSPSDSLPINAYLLGLKTPYDGRLNHFDINNNGIISHFDSWLISAYFAGGFDGQNAVSDDSNAFDLYSTNSLTYYWRHDCSDKNFHSYTRYSLSEKNWSPYTRDYQLIDPADMMKVDDGETAVVRLLNLNSDIDNDYCTGTIVGDHVIATAAHCVYSSNKGFYNMQIDIIDDGTTPIDTFHPRYIHIPEDYMKLGKVDTTADYALIYVEEDLSEYGMFDLGIAMDSFAAASTGTEKVKVSGFPVYEQNMPAGAVVGQRYVAEGNVTVPVNSNPDVYINHNAHVTYGHSGSPIYVEETFSKKGLSYKRKTLIAIHTNGNLILDTNGNLYYVYGFGTRITQKHLLFYLNNEHLAV